MSVQKLFYRFFDELCSLQRKILKKICINAVNNEIKYYIQIRVVIVFPVITRLQIFNKKHKHFSLFLLFV